jgi:hypothetical protein
MSVNEASMLRLSLPQMTTLMEQYAARAADKLPRRESRALRRATRHDIAQFEDAFSRSDASTIGEMLRSTRADSVDRSEAAAAAARRVQTGALVASAGLLLLTPLTLGQSLFGLPVMLAMGAASHRSARHQAAAAQALQSGARATPEQQTFDRWLHAFATSNTLEADEALHGIIRR